MISPAGKPKQELMDKAGIFLSTLCLIHCTVLPLLLAALQAYGATLVPKSLDNGIFHAALAFVLLGVGSLAFIQGYRRHGRVLPLAAGALGTSFLFLGAFNPGSTFSESGEHFVTILGTLVLLYAHSKNRSPESGHHCHIEGCAESA
jgi:peptidoglycan/LPS O-acetylase OafA/YrhL